MKIQLPKIIFGSSALGNLYERVPQETKLAIVEQWIKCLPELTVIDSAGKYCAGLALENIGRLLKQLNVDPSSVLISNKLGWKRVPLTAPEPTFDQGLWIDCHHDVVARISYDGILECYEQGDELLGDYDAQLLSVHDPDEYIAAATSCDDAQHRYLNVLDAYRALAELRDAGKVRGIGVGSKDWRIIRRLFDDQVRFDWVMFANSFTLRSHPQEMLDFMAVLDAADVSIINSAVFNSGFLIGGKHMDYQIVTVQSHPELFAWRDRFHSLCETHNVSPTLACCQFALSPPGVCSLALSSSKPEWEADNAAMVHDKVPAEFWQAMKKNQLLADDYPYL